MELYIQKLREIICELENVPNGQQSTFDAIVLRLNSIIKRKFTEDRGYFQKIVAIQTIVSPVSRVQKHDCARLIGVVKILIDDIEFDDIMDKNNPLLISENKLELNINNENHVTRKIFIVHGHNDLLKEQIARTISKLGLEPIILHEQSNNGGTIIEKFEKHSNVDFAIVLLTADDEGYSKKSNVPQSRARQNVILELGYFLGKLGRKKVVTIYESGVEIPSDLHGLVYIEFDKKSSWKYELVKELRDTGYDIDANSIL